jgi:adenine/guanine phosphoribosyltransferase-like PRPP-binding protein
MKICIVSSLSEADELMLEILEERRILAVCGVVWRGVAWASECAVAMSVAVVDVDRHGEITEMSVVRGRLMEKGRVSRGQEQQVIYV